MSEHDERGGSVARGQGEAAEASFESRVALVDLADELQVRKQRLFKLLARLEIRPTQRRDPDRGNQMVATVTLPEATALRNALGAGVTELRGGNQLASSVGPYVADDVGVFYLIQLEPDHDPLRVKVGFTTELEGRLQKHRCSAPFARCVKSWPCRRTWERAAIDCATYGFEQLHTEVFRAISLEALAARADAFFALMPPLIALPDGDVDEGPVTGMSTGDPPLTAGTLQETEST